MKKQAFFSEISPATAEELNKRLAAIQAAHPALRLSKRQAFEQFLAEAFEALRLYRRDSIAKKK
jgi:hypothetical protein